MPDYLQAHPDGPAVWNAVHSLYPGLRHVEPGLVHIDYQPGNILWDGKQISAILDWEEAALGDPGIDVAYLYTDLAIQFSQELAEEFLRAYEAEIGRRVENLEL
jgi:aminoglycoside phosphotransferase (APT) family kinase protein